MDFSKYFCQMKRTSGPLKGETLLVTRSKRREQHSGRETVMK